MRLMKFFEECNSSKRVVGKSIVGIEAHANTSQKIRTIELEGKVIKLQIVSSKYPMTLKFHENLCHNLFPTDFLFSKPQTCSHI